MLKKYEIQTKVYYTEHVLHFSIGVFFIYRCFICILNLFHFIVLSFRVNGKPVQLLDNVLADL